MNPKQLSLYRKSVEQLRRTSFQSYLGMMGELFRLHSTYEFVRHLQGLFRSRRYDLALTYADSLSGQKYPDATMHYVANQFSQLVKKYPWDSDLVKTDPRQTAVRTFLKAEHKCSRINRRFKLYGSFRSPFEYDLNEARNYVRYVLGMSPNLSSILSKSGFGAGANIGVHGNATNLGRKLLSEQWTVSPGASAYALVALAQNAQARDLLLESRNYVSCYDTDSFKKNFVSKRALVDYNKISFVPKTAKTHRAIAVEPLLNGLVQKGIDLEMRLRLKRIGIDLSDQGRNQQLAREGSLDDSDNGFVTIDLSSASDSISIELARYLLPEAWFRLLDDTRSKSFKLDGQVRTYHKFCSMGNGFCFPLETLIFVACCKASGCGEPGADFSVYGDDIIVRKKHALKVLSLLQVMGFKTNSGKTFLQGPFRESCGSDWFGGTDVRPYTLDHKIDSIENVFKCLNLTRRNQLCCWFFSGTRDFILSLIPVQFHFFRPFIGNADSGIDSLAEEYLTSPHVSWCKSRSAWRWKELLHTSVADRRLARDGYRRDSVDMYALLSGSVSQDYKVVFTLRRKTRTTIRIVYGAGATSQWLPGRRFAYSGWNSFSAPGIA